MTRTSRRMFFPPEAALISSGLGKGAEEAHEFAALQAGVRGHPGLTMGRSRAVQMGLAWLGVEDMYESDDTSRP